VAAGVAVEAGLAEDVGVINLLTWHSRHACGAFRVASLLDARVWQVIQRPWYALSLVNSPDSSTPIALATSRGYLTLLGGYSAVFGVAG
jgi:hypothetical protein